MLIFDQGFQAPQIHIHKIPNVQENYSQATNIAKQTETKLEKAKKIRSLIRTAFYDRK
jgi:hypothetical protein